MINISGLVNWTNESINLSLENLSGRLCPFEATASFNYSGHIIINFLAFIWLFAEMRYNFQRNILKISPKRAVMNNKFLIVMMSVYNTIFLLNQFLLIPLFNYLRGFYGL